jgi:RNA-directed DNA polymerase
MRKRPAKDGVGQLVLQIAFPQEKTSHTAEETQDNGPQASNASLTPRSQTETKRKWYSLYDKVFALPNLEAAWEKVRANDGAPGIDGVSVARFGRDTQARLQNLSTDLRNKTYRPAPVRRVFIPKSGGGQRPLGIPCVRDRIVQQALLQVLEPIFEDKFSKLSHGFRPDRGCPTALSVVDRAVRHGYSWVVDADIATFFDTVDHDLLIASVNAEIADGSVLNLIARILKAGIAHPSVTDVEPTELGTPQGGPLSPLLANVYLHRFDVAMATTGYGLVRYADDFVIFAKSEEAATAALNLSRQVLEGELKLRLHPEKTRVVSVASGFEFLGFHYFIEAGTDRVVKEVRPKSVQRFRDAVRKRTPRLKTQRRRKARQVTLPRLLANEQVRPMIQRLNRLLLGWHGYFRSVWSRYPNSPFRNFDGFVRQRVRSAITGRVGPGWWNVRLNNRTLSALGLLSLDDLQREYQSGLNAFPARKG